MKFSPLNIEQQEFNKGIRGYDVQEVRTYLENVAAAFAELQEEKESLKRDLGKVQRKNEEFQKIEKSLQSTLLSAQESSSKTVEDAKKKTYEILNDAESKAENIVSDARTEAEYLRNSVIHLREEKNLLLARLKAIVETQAKVLNITTETTGTRNNPKDNTGDNINVDEIVEKLL